MKFGESLSEGLVPEWKDQYVDYKFGKKCIKSMELISDQLSAQLPSDTTPLLSPADAERMYTPTRAEENVGSETNDQELHIRNVDAHGNLAGSEDGTAPVLLLAPPRPHTKSDTKLLVTSSMRGSIKNLMRRSGVKSLSETFVEEKQHFIKWLDDELEMVDSFYKEQEKTIYARFLILEDQFFLLKEHKAVLVRLSQQASNTEQHKKIVKPVNVTLSRWSLYFESVIQPLSRYDLPSLPSMAFLDRFLSRSASDEHLLHLTLKDSEFDLHFRENQIRNGQLAVESEFDDDLVFDLNSVQVFDGNREVRRSNETTLSPLDPEHAALQRRQARRKDYVTKKHFGVPYYYARKQLKDALVEHYRSIALIRSYRTMNRTAFRKITKKFDKATRLSISGAFMKKVDEESYFQTSETLDQILTRVEDIFLTFFDNEKNDRKRGLEKLRSTTYAYNNSDIRVHSYSKASFLSGLFIGIALPFLGIGLYIALRRTLSRVLLEGKYLLQIWGGFFLINLSILLVGINFIAYTHFKINYKFIFEFNLANTLDYRQFFLLPSLGFGLLCSFAWLSFLDFWPDKLPGRVWPLIYLFCALAIFLWPGAQLYPASRRWLQVAIWRLVCSGFYPVEFRDFYLGNIVCSLTYSVSNLSFFICLYADKWRYVLGGGTIPESSELCGSGHSRLMGFLAALPSIWRFLQCLRRYMDSGDAFPHLANMIKYTVSTIHFCLLSIWRIEQTNSARAAFIVVACINTILCSAWDIVMDWSLGQVSSKNYLLRDNLFYPNPAYYYAAMVLDVILRLQWIFYAFFSAQIQQLAVTSFCIALAEVLRRFMWLFLRLENEHCANVVMFRASRESPLPYMVSGKVERAINKLVDLRYNTREKLSDDEVSSDNIAIPYAPQITTTAYAGANAEESGFGGSPSGLSGTRERRKLTFMNIANVLNKAHIKEFQRKKHAVQAEDSEDDDMEEENESAIEDEE